MYIVSGKWILSQDTVDGQIQINISNTGTNADCTSYVRSAGLHCDSLMGEIPTTLKSHVLFFSYFFPTLLHFFNARVIIFSSSSFRDSTKWTHCDLLFAPASTSSHIQSCNHFRWYLTIFSSSPLLLSLKPLQPRSRFPTRCICKNRCRCSREQAPQSFHEIGVPKQELHPSSSVYGQWTVQWTMFRMSRTRGDFSVFTHPRPPIISSADPRF